MYYFHPSSCQKMSSYHILLGQYVRFCHFKSCFFILTFWLLVVWYNVGSLILFQRPWLYNWSHIISHLPSDCGVRSLRKADSSDYSHLEFQMSAVWILFHWRSECSESDMLCSLENGKQFDSRDSCCWVCLMADKNSTDFIKTFFFYISGI